MGKIQLLSQQTIDLIAAGEVVERPASVLKELLENSIDAGATNIRVIIEESGTRLISVNDNGSGMGKEDLELAFVQHATSKIKTSDDLNNINSFGFRGEALASIAAVSGEVSASSKTDKDKGVNYRITGESKTFQELDSDEIGTSIDIINLFERIPARKKFLKSLQTEHKYLVDTFLQTALIHTNIHFELKNKDRTLYKLPKTEDITTRIYDIWGREIAENFFTKTEYWDDKCNITLYLAKPEICKSTAFLQYEYVNGRFINNKTILSAINEGYKGFIHRDLRPAFIAIIHIKPELVDVNIHPRKLEVKFQDSDVIFKRIFSLTRKKLESESKMQINESMPFNSPLEEPSWIGQDSIPTNTYSPLKSIVTSFSQKSYGNNKIQEAFSFTEEIFNVTETQQSFANSNIEVVPIQIFDTYIVYEKENILVFIDQHAAAEKILFEKLIANKGKSIQKPLLVPEILELTRHDKEYILNEKKSLDQIGIIIDDFGDNSIQLLEIPENLDHIDFREYVNMVLNPDSGLIKYYEALDNKLNLSKDEYLLLATTACHSSIRAGQKLREEEMQSIINALSMLNNPGNCPHGRPTMWQISKYEIEKNFRRNL